MHCIVRGKDSSGQMYTAVSLVTNFTPTATAVAGCYCCSIFMAIGFSSAVAEAVVAGKCNLDIHVRVEAGASNASIHIIPEGREQGKRILNSLANQ